MTSTELAVLDGGPMAPVVTAEHIDLVRRTIAADATPDELGLFLYDCKRQGVHPLDRLLHFTKRGGKYTPITSIDLMRTRAHDTGEFAGIDDAEFTGEPRRDGFAARVTVYRLVQGQPRPFPATARWQEYYPGDRAGTMWNKMPHVMLGKCAEALALRKAFPRQLSGLYAAEEMDQAGQPRGAAPVNRVTGEVIEEAPTPDPQPQTNGLTPDEAMRRKYSRKIHAQLGSLGCDPDDRPLVHHVLAGILGHEVATFKDLSLDDMETVAANLGAWTPADMDKATGDYNPPDVEADPFEEDEREMAERAAALAAQEEHGAGPLVDVPPAPSKKTNPGVGH